jgi:hypothetical protein
MDFELFEWFGLHFIVFRKRSQQEPFTPLQSENLNHSGYWVNQPNMADSMLCIDRQLFGPIHDEGPRGENFADPIRRNRDPIGFRRTGESFESPAGQVRNKEILVIETNLGFCEKDPAARSATASVERRA